MKKSFPHSQASLFDLQRSDRRSLVPMVVVSTMCHLLLFGALMYIPQFNVPRRYVPSVIDVSLVSLPSAAPETPAEPSSRAPATTAPPEPVAPREVPPPVAEPVAPKTAVSIPDKVAPKPPKPVGPPAKKEVKRSLKKQTFKPEQVVKQAISEIEKKVETERPSPVSQAIDQLREKIKQGPPPSSAPPAQTQPSAGARRGFASTGDRNGRETFDQLDIYKAEIPFHIQKNWAFSESLAGPNGDLEALIVVKIMSSGEIRDIWFEKKSGNRYFDESAYKAVQKSNPLPPLPKGYLRPFLNVGLRFTPEGLK